MAPPSTRAEDFNTRQEVAVMEFFNIRAELLPWFFAAQTLSLIHI